MIKIKHKGGFENTERLFARYKHLERSVTNILHRYGKQGVVLLSNATPVDSGLASKSWDYSVVRSSKGVLLTFDNYNVEKGYSIIVLIEHGHATKSGGFVEGRPFVNKTLEPIFKKINEEIGREVANL